jgi:hypothetical protein
VNRDHGNISASEADAAIKLLRNHDVRSDYEKYFYRAAFSQQHALNVSGGSEKLAYYISGGYDNNIGELHQTYQRWNIRTDNVYRLNKNLQLSLGFTYTHIESKSGRPAYNQVLIGRRRIPYLPLADEKGNPLAVAKDYRAAYIDTAGGGRLNDWHYYPLEEYLHNNTKTENEHLLADIGFQWRIRSSFRFEVKYQYERQQSATRNLQDEFSYGARNIVNRFSQLDYNTGQVSYGVPPGSILNISEGHTGVHNLRGQADFSKQWNRHSVVFIGGAELRQIGNKGSSNALYGYDDNLLLTSNVDFVNPQRVFTDGNYENIPDYLSLSEQLNRFASFYSNIAYTYNGRYTISASGRKDASNVFGVKTNDKWNPLWSAGLAWDIKKEGFFKLDAINQLKLRSTYGFGGNMDLNRAAVTTLIYAGPDFYTNLRYAQVDQFANPELRWEKTGTINVGIDFATWQQRLSGSIDYFHKTSTDLFGPSVVDYTAGLNRDVLITNAASIKGNGIDVQLVSKNIKGKKFGWETGLLFSYNKSKTTAFYRASNLSFLFVRDGNYITPINGKPLYSIYSYAWGGLNIQGNPQGYIDHTLSTDYNRIMFSNKGVDGLVFAGPALPVFYGALSNTLNYKGFAVSANISYKLGYYYRRESLNYRALLSTGQGYSDYEKRWQKPGDELRTNVPGFVYPLVSGRDEFYNNSEMTVHKADNIRLQFVNMSYDLTLGKKAQHLQLYVNAANLGILWQADKGGPDPDYPNVIPPVKFIAFGLRTNF